VYREVVSEGDGRTGAEETQGAVNDGWLVIEALQEPADAVRMQQAFLLGDGESEALALARQQPTDVILLDEARAVRCAREWGYRCFGRWACSYKPGPKAILNRFTPPSISFAQRVSG
jgi:predicted nucleic acid-binding protein